MEAVSLETIRGAISSTSTGDWHSIDSYHSHQGFELVGTSSSENSITDVFTHDYRYVLTSNIDISLEWGFEVHPGMDDELYPELGSFPDPKQKGVYIDVLYRGAVVERIFGIYVDGFRALLPLSKQESLPGRQGSEKIEDYVHTVDKWDYTLVRLVHSLIHSHSFEDYFDRTEMRRGF